MTTKEMNITTLADKIIAGYQITRGEALLATQTDDVETLYREADKIRRHFRGDHFTTCSIINARSGRCPEDCKWCAQSRWHKTGIEEYPLIEPSEAVEMAVHNAKKGVERFSLVTSGRTMNDAEIERAVGIYQEVRANAQIDLCASMGLLTKSQLQKLYDAGIRHYHCNIETAPSYFSHLCTTHTIDDKLRTIRWAQEVGMGVCSGGIIGMGETMEQRVEMAIYLRDVVRAVSVPINVLMPIKGTALEGSAPLTVREILTTFALFRFCNPRAEIRMAGGRVKFNGHQAEALACGVDASIVGDMLTTTGTGGIDEDMKLFHSCGRTTAK